MTPAALNRRVWVVTECYPHPQARHRCAFAHRQMVGMVESGWRVRAMVPNGWFPPVVWHVAPAWRRARSTSIPVGWSVDDIPVDDLRVQNRVPSRLCNPRSVSDRVALALRTELRTSASPPGILLAQFALPYGPAVRAAAAAHRLPYVVYLRGDDVWIWPHQSPDHLSAFRNVVRDAALVVGVSRAILDEAERLAGPPSITTVVVPNGVDAQLFRPAERGERDRLRHELGMRSDQFMILCVAPQLVSKGWVDLLDALGELPYADGELVLHCAVSSLRDEIDISKEAARRSPRVRVVIERDVKHERLAKLFRAADVFALPSHGEGLSNAVLEAMASGVAVVTTRVGGHAEIIDHGRDGLLVSPRDACELRDAIRSLLESPMERTSMGISARRRAERIGDWRAAGRALSDLFDAVIRADLPSDLLARNPYAPRLDSVDAELRSTVA